ncbi:MAG TPA: helix-hairpin-helix domain-containing protein, partial [Methanomicrobiales archaeon]|nr:helix-hairpin-helix domain-containing protein [Methanomicrobiales archaeon]
PPVSLKKYREAGIDDPEEFCSLHPVYISHKTGIRLDTVYRHVEKLCTFLERESPKRVSQATMERGRSELLAIPGIGDATLERLYRAGVIDAESLVHANPEKVAAQSGIPISTIREYILALKGREYSHKSDLIKEAATR